MNANHHFARLKTMSENEMESRLRSFKTELLQELSTTTPTQKENETLNQDEVEKIKTTISSSFHSINQEESQSLAITLIKLFGSSLVEKILEEKKPKNEEIAKESKPSSDQIDTNELCNKIESHEAVIDELHLQIEDLQRQISNLADQNKKLSDATTESRRLIGIVTYNTDKNKDDIVELKTVTNGLLEKSKEKDSNVISGTSFFLPINLAGMTNGVELIYDFGSGRVGPKV